MSALIRGAVKSVQQINCGDGAGGAFTKSFTISAVNTAKSVVMIASTELMEVSITSSTTIRTQRLSNAALVFATAYVIEYY